MQIKLPFNIPVNYKTIIIGILSFIIVILLILSLIIPKNRPINKTINLKVTSTPKITAVPTKELPSEIQVKINSVDEKINSPAEIEPPLIDEKIGL